MLNELFDQQRQYLNTFFDQLDRVKAEEVLQLCHACKGMIVLTGVGKSGIVAKKIAVTMTSTGSRALYLSPTNALHGDIGIVSKNDLCVFISKSGESDELLQMIPFLRNRGVKLVAIISNPDSRLAKACDVVMELPIEKELCPFDMVPTTSTEVQMIFGDALAVALMQKKAFGLDDFAENHPAGRIGKRITLRVKDLMLKDQGIPLCHPEDKLVDILVPELSNKQCGCVLVVDREGSLKGIFTDGDLRRALEKEGGKILELPMSDMMVQSARFIRPSELALAAMEEMEGDQKHPITVLPVVDDQNKVVGIIKMHDIVQSGL